LAGDGVLPGRRFCLVPIHKWLFSPISALGKNFNPRNINHMPAVKISARLELDETISFLDGHELLPIHKWPICLFVDGHELLFSDMEAQIVVK
jgi:hypothetical protein